MSASIVTDLCPECCACPTAFPMWVAGSASVTKVGRPGFVDTTKIYRTVSFTATSAAVGNNLGAAGCGDWSQDVTRSTSSSINEDTMEVTCSGGTTIATSLQYGDSATCHIPDYNGYYPCEPGATSPGTTPTLYPEGTYFPPWVMTAMDQTSRSWSLTSAVTSPGNESTLTANETATLSDEYTTALLLGKAAALTPELDDTYGYGSVAFEGSRFWLTSDEQSAGVNRARYRMYFDRQALISGNQTCYWVTWKERFTPKPGTAGSVSDTYRCAKWAGEMWEAAPGMPEDEYEGLGVLPGTFTLEPPGALGEITIVDINAHCGRCANACSE